MINKTLKNYYELTVIPSIVLGCITSLLMYPWHYYGDGYCYVTVGEIIFSFFYFLIFMTVVDSGRLLVNHLFKK